MVDNNVLSYCSVHDTTNQFASAQSTSIGESEERDTASEKEHCFKHVNSSYFKNVRIY